MQRVYSHPDVGIVHLVKNELDNLGIETIIRGEHAAAIMGGGAGIDAWTELWIVDDGRALEAAEVVHRVIEADDVEEGEPWTCPSCGEKVDRSFAICWNCGHSAPHAAA